MNLLKVPIVEIFESFQGEGRFAGQRALFIRFAGCNLAGKCKYCDTDFRVRKLMTLNGIVSSVMDYLANDGELVVFTGGEPMIYQNVIADIISYSDRDGRAIFQIETNGTIRPSSSFVEWIDRIVVSPKRGYEGKAYKNFASNGLMLKRITDWKYVVGNVPKDSTFWSFKEIGNEIQFLQDMYDIRKDHIWLMPFGATEEEIKKNSEEVWKLARKLGVNYSDRIHIRVWGRSLMGV